MGYFEGALFIFVLGFAIAAARGLLVVVVKSLLRRVCVEAEITAEDDAYYWFQRWLDTQPYIRTARRVSIVTKPSASGLVDIDKVLKREPRRIFMTPAPGWHVLRWRGKWLIIQRDRKQQRPLTAAAGAMVPQQQQSPQQELFLIFAVGGDTGFVHELISDARDVAMPPDDVRVMVRIPSWQGWKTSSRLARRSISSVILDGNQAEMMLEDAKRFLGEEHWYASHGVPHRRGYLLEGPPGGGKTSIVHAIASELHLDIYSLTLSGGVTDDMLFQCMGSVDSPCIVLVEDVDSAFNGREPAKTNNHLSFSALLNAIDGVSSVDGRLLFLTTNHPDKLDEALVRAGRIDVRVHVGLASRDQARRIFLKFFPGHDSLADDFANELRQGTSMAYLQEVLVANRHSAASACLSMASNNRKLA